MYQEPTTGPIQNGGPPEDQPSPNRSIFRSEAMEHYLQNQEKVELPGLISTKLFRTLWLIALLLMVVGSFVAFWPLIEQLR